MPCLQFSFMCAKCKKHLFVSRNVWCRNHIFFVEFYWKEKGDKNKKLKPLVLIFFIASSLQCIYKTDSRNGFEFPLTYPLIPTLRGCRPRSPSPIPGQISWSLNLYKYKRQSIRGRIRLTVFMIYHKSIVAFSFFQNTWLPVRCPWSPWQVKQFHKNLTSTVLTQHCWSNTKTYSGGFFLALLAWFCHSWSFILINIRSSGLMWNQILVPAEKKIFVKVP